MNRTGYALHKQRFQRIEYFMFTLLIQSISTNLPQVRIMSVNIFDTDIISHKILQDSRYQEQIVALP